MRKVIAGLPKRDPEIELVGECGSFTETMLRAAELRPQVVVLDVHMSDERVLTFSELKSGLIGSRLLTISPWKDDEKKTVAEALTLLDKTKLLIELILAIKRDFNQFT